MGTLEKAHSPMSSVSVVLVVEDVIPAAEEIATAGNLLAEYFLDSEIVFVANGISDELAVSLKKIVAETPDAACVFLGDRVDLDIARIVGIDHAIGDYVLLSLPPAAALSVLDSMFSVAREGFDLVIARSKTPPNQERSLYHLSRWLFLRCLRLLTGIAIDSDPSPLRLLTRPAALHVLNQRHAEFLLKSSEIGGGFPTKVLEDAYEEPVGGAHRSMSQSMGKGLRAIISSGAVPIRLASITALASGGLALFYSLYVVGTYFFKADVAPGWTTVSLQVSGMMFLFAVIFALLSEYVMQIYEAMPVSRRRLVTREVRSDVTRRSGRLNIVDSEGHFQLGAPAELLPTTPEGEKDEVAG